MRAVPVSMSQPIVSTSTGNWPTDWQASSRNGTPADRAMAPTAATGLIWPLDDGTWLIAIRRVRGPMRA